FLTTIPSQGLALLLIGILTAMLLRPMNMTSNWSANRMGSIRPVTAHLNKRRGEVIRSLKDHKNIKAARKLVSENAARLYKIHGIRPGLGCLMWIVIFPVLIGFYSAINTGCALKGTEFLWIKDLALPDNFYPLQEPLIDIDLLRGMANDPNVTMPPYSFSFTFFKMDSIHLLPILLYTLPWVETIILRLMGIKAPFRVLTTLIFFVIFMWFFYSLPAGAH
ncbi:MAG: YidC/Oxa1 family membrane protein insertase, partial [Planctomycetota bacterium]|nr:YidC/Oxa1 family membrane protein insertase [Planctomycetota bacterium]